MIAQILPLPNSSLPTPQPVEPQRRSPRGPTCTTVQGDKFEAERDIAEVAKLVRADIKAAISAGLLPFGTKCSVRVERYSMGRNLHVSVTACPIMVANPVYVRWQQANRHASMLEAPPSARDRFSPEGRHVITTLERIVEAYNRRISSDQPDDYSNVSFYTDIVFGLELREEQSASILALQPQVNLRNSWKPAASSATGQI